MRRLRLDRPLWLDRTGGTGAARHPRLRRRIDVDVAIGGGGVTGAIAAWMLASEGVSVALLEAQRVGRGSTAASTALLMQEPDVDLATLAARYGHRIAIEIWRTSQRMNQTFIRTLKRLRIRCDLEARDSLYVALDEDHSLEEELRARQQAGLGGRWLDPLGVRRATGITGFGAIRLRGNAQADPYKVCLGFLERAAFSGAAIFEGTRVRRIDSDTQGVVAHVQGGGRVHCRQIVIATGYATADFKPLAGQFRLQHTYVVATEPLSRADRYRIGLARVMLWDTRRPYHYARWTRDSRLIIGGGDRGQVGGRARARAFKEGIAEVRDHFVRLYPALQAIRFEHAWEGLFATTSDGLPYVGPHRRYPRHLFALGYGGNGMTFGFMAAALLRDTILGRSNPSAPLFAFNRAKVLSRR